MSIVGITAAAYYRIAGRSYRRVCRSYRVAPTASAGRMRAMKTSLVVVLVALIPACKSSDASSQADSVPCATGAAELAKRLTLANGYNLDLQKPDVQKQIAAAKTELIGKRFAFEGCAFKSQGNDEVSFAATAASDDRIECTMIGGADGNKKFRHAAMAFELSKLRLDVTGTVAERGDGVFKRVRLVDCEIVPHE
jgi:hypothetical protein